jgi:hypothetical protein
MTSVAGYLLPPVAIHLTDEGLPRGRKAPKQRPSLPLTPKAMALILSLYG